MNKERKIKKDTELTIMDMVYNNTSPLEPMSSTLNTIEKKFLFDMLEEFPKEADIFNIVYILRGNVVYIIFVNKYNIYPLHQLSVYDIYREKNYTVADYISKFLDNPQFSNTMANVLADNAVDKNYTLFHYICSPTLTEQIIIIPGMKL